MIPQQAHLLTEDTLTRRPGGLAVEEHDKLRFLPQVPGQGGHAEERKAGGGCRGEMAVHGDAGGGGQAHAGLPAHHDRYHHVQHG